MGVYPRGWAHGVLVSWYGKSIPRRRCIVGMKVRTTTLTMRTGRTSDRRQQ